MVAIVIVAIGAVTILALVARANAQSGRNLVQIEASAIAAAYLNEILGRPFDDPNGMDGEGARGAFDDVDDYHGLNDNGARDAAGNLLPGGERFTVAVQVVNVAALPSAPAADTLMATVTVTDPVGGTVVLAGLRLRP